MKIKCVITNNEPNEITVDVEEDKTGAVTIPAGASHTFTASDGERYFALRAKK